MAPGKSASRTQTVRSQVAEVVLHLRDIQSAVVVAAAALKQQKCELDEDIAHVLSRSVADRIQDQIDRLEITVQLAAELEKKN
jgi:hypothetical protein